MEIDPLIVMAYELADAFTEDIQPNVLHEQWIGQTVAGKALYATGVLRAAIVEDTKVQATNRDGQIVTSTALVHFLRPIADPTGVVGRVGGVDPRDRITLPEGQVVQVLHNDGLVSKTTGKKYGHEVLVG